jgi:hypothetical protein
MANLLESIQTDIIGAVPLSDVLRKAKILAYRLKNEEFKAWIDHELDGYYGVHLDAMPTYRIIATTSYGDFFNGVWHHKNSPMPMEVFDDDMGHIRDMLNQAIFRQGIRELESLIEQAVANSENGLRMAWPDAARNYVSSRLEGDYQCISAWQALTATPLIGILDTVKNRLLTLTLELADRYPEAAQLDFAAAAKNPSSQQVGQVVHLTIHGDHATVNPGSATYQTEAITMNKVEFGDGNTFQGDFVVAHSIEQSFNRAAASDLADPAKELLQQLVRAVSDMSKELSPDEAHQAARTVETLTAKATSKTPRKEWIVMSADGLIKAATNIGKVGVPVVTLLKELVPMLTG